MPTVAPKVIYHKFTGKYTQIPDPRDKTKMMDDLPIFEAFQGEVRGPYDVIKPPKMERLPDGNYKCTDNGELRYKPDIYEITIPHGSGWRNLAIESWHLDVNFGTEWMPKVGYVENAIKKPQALKMHGQRSYFEFVEEAELVGAGAPSTPPNPPETKQETKSRVK